MEKYLHKLKHYKKIIIIAVIAVLVMIVTFVVLVIMLISWLFDRGGDQVRQASKVATEQVESKSISVPSLDLQSYISNNQVDTKQLENTYNSLPDTVKSLWLDQLGAQIEALKAQIGITDETIRTLTALHDGLKWAQGQ